MVRAGSNYMVKLVKLCMSLYNFINEIKRKKATAGADEIFYASFLLVIHAAMIYKWAHCAQ